MTRLVEKFGSFWQRLVKRPRDHLLARLRAHMARAVNEGLDDVVRHVTAERKLLAAELTQRMAADFTPIRRQLDDVNVCNDGLLREVVRLEREVQQLWEAFERLSLERPAPETLPASTSRSETPHLKLVDDRHARAA